MIQDILRSCHEGQTGGHFGISRTFDQVWRRFYWTSWKADTIRFCKRCDKCNEYHRGKLRRTGPLQPVIAGAPYERWYDDFVEGVRSRMTEAFEETRIALRRAAERNKRYYDVRVRPKKYQTGDWLSARLHRSLCSSNAEKRPCRSRFILTR